MSVRGQNNEAWLKRWRDGACPIHGRGFVVDTSASAAAATAGPADAFVRVRCAVDECDVRAARWPGTDEHHASFGFLAGPDNVRALLAKAGDVDASSPAPGKRARMVRISYRLEE
mgnify:CR=1 FL=1